MHNNKIQDNLVQLVEPIIRKAGDIVLSYYQKTLVWKEKKDKGFVTEADIASEEYLISALRKVLPEAAFFAEESGVQGNSDYRWVIDPLDGTTNFAYAIPYFCISVALTYRDIPIFGIIYLPLTDELFYAEKGKGAFLNGNRINVAQERPLQKSLLLVGFPYAKGEAFLSVFNHLRAISQHTYAFRHLGAIAVDLAYVACGRADGVFFEDLAWWDVAAGILLIEEAGGKVSTYENENVTPLYRSFIAANDTLHAHLLNSFASHTTTR